MKTFSMVQILKIPEDILVRYSLTKETEQHSHSKNSIILNQRKHFLLEEVQKSCSILPT